MAKDDRDILEMLKSELDFVEKGGYGRSVRTPWKATSVFQDSPTCLNFCDPNRSHSCSDCLLIEFVPPEHRSAGVPCHRIPLNGHDQTIESLELAGNQDDQEEAVKTWLRSTISRIEQVRDQLAAAQRRDCEKQTPSNGRKRILVVDDDEPVLIGLEALLEGEGYDTATAWSGQEALRLLRLNSFDLVLLDDYLPDVPSEEILRQIRMAERKVLVVIMHGADLPDDAVARYAGMGVCYFLRKRDPGEIAVLADRWLTLAQSKARPCCA